MKFSLSFWKNASPRRKRLYSLLFVFVLAFVMTGLGTLVPLSAQDAKQITDSTNQTIAEGTANGTLAQSIFLNNFPLCLLMFIPLAGFFIGLFIMFSTGIAIGAIIRTQSASDVSSAAANITPNIAVLILISAVLTFLMEYISYSIGMSESLWLFRRLLKRRWRELKNTAILIGVCAALLVIGAIVETWGITLPS
jgi:hypothetical protein